VPAADADEFLERWRTSFVTTFPGRAGKAKFLRTAPGPAAHEEDVT